MAEETNDEVTSNHMQMTARALFEVKLRLSRLRP